MLSVELLAKHAGMSPLQYQKRLRLQVARRLMPGEGMDVAAAAFRVGYQSASQFGREYRRTFGETPRRDVDAIKAEAKPTKRLGGLV